MVKKYSFGKVFDTEAVVKKVRAEKEAVPYFTQQSNDEEETITFTCQMGKEDKVYGLGEQIRGINKRGHIYVNECADDPVHSEEKRSLYGAHNFILVDGTERFLVFFDTPQKVTFDIGYTDLDVLAVTTGKDVDLYVVTGKKLLDIIKEFRKLIGRSYIAPRWALGYQQSRWSYKSADEIRQVVRGHRDNHIPLDTVYMDIDYMDAYKDFTINEEAFPKFPEFVKEMKKEHVRLIPIIDAGVKIEKGYDIYEEGVEQNYFCKDEEGRDFVGAVWPGKVHFPDFLNPDARKWFGSKYKYLLDQGIEGFWNDMNEPAIFYSEKGLEEAIEFVGTFKGKNVGIWEFFAIKDKVLGIANSPADYQSFYHNTKEGKIRHDKLHNLYGYNMTRAASEAFEELEPDKRILMFSRASYIGMHRSGGIWQGDNMSWWSHLLLTIKMLPSLNMCGFVYTGSDLGGFGADATEDLVMRWTQFSLFTPLMRNHAALGTREQEPYQFKNMEDFKNIIDIRYGLLSYIYSEYMKAVLNNDMYAKPLSFVYEEDPHASQVEDQLMLGDEIMIAPVYTQNATGRYVYLPENMMAVKMRSLTEYDCKVLEKGHHYVDVASNELIFFVRENRIIPMTTGGEFTEQLDFTNLKILGYVTKKAKYSLYTDDGVSKDYDNPENYVEIKVDKTGKAVVSSPKIQVNSCEILN
ncbi:MAG: alpha-glucosidase [Lachnospiraceae bacterium]|nr:alpha-glucosidase [Lachnospiraceae bacterium]